MVEVKESDHQDHKGYLKEDSKFIETIPKPITITSHDTLDSSEGRMIPRMFTVE